MADIFANQILRKPLSDKGFQVWQKPEYFLGKELRNNIIWILRYRIKNGKAPLSVRINVNGERAEIMANWEIAPGLWDSNAQRVKGTTEEARSINAHLETMKGSLRLSVREN